jgi:hypothetical protein
MKRFFGFFLAATVALVLMGCIDNTTKVTVKPDGSGTVDKTIILSKHLAELMISMGQKGDAASIEQGMLNEKGLKAAAARMGQGVSFVSAQKITTAKGNGYQVQYAFTDISKLKLDQNPAADLTMPTGQTGSTSSPTEAVTFAFAKGTPATLTVIAPKQTATKPSAAPAASSADADKLMAQMKPLYSDMHLVLMISVLGTVTETNAAYASGSTITLLDMDFATIMADDATVKKLTAMQSQSMTDVKAAVKALPGIKIDTQDSVKISFK